MFCEAAAHSGLLCSDLLWKIMEWRPGLIYISISSISLNFHGIPMNSFRATFIKLPLLYSFFFLFKKWYLLGAQITSFVIIQYCIDSLSATIWFLFNQGACNWFQTILCKHLKQSFTFPLRKIKFIWLDNFIAEIFQTIFLQGDTMLYILQDRIEVKKKYNKCIINGHQY